MLEWKMIKIQEKSFVGMHMRLPKQGIYIITSTKCTLLGTVFQVEKMNPNSCFFIMEKSDSYRSLLCSQVIAMNDEAKRRGYQLGMNGKEVLMYGATKKAET